MSIKATPKVKQPHPLMLPSHVVAKLMLEFEDNETVIRKTRRDIETMEQPIELESRKLLRLIYGEPFQYKELEIRLRKHYTRRQITERDAQRVIRELLELGLIELRGHTQFRNRDGANRWYKLPYYELTELGVGKAHPIAYPPTYESGGYTPSIFNSILRVRPTLLEVV